MSDPRPPEGARWNIPDWKPFDEPEPKQAPPSPPPGPAKTPKMGIEVPITIADFREHWRDLAQYARLDREDVEAFTNTDHVGTLADALGLRFDFKLDPDQERELKDTGWCTLTLPQVEQIIRLVEAAHREFPERIQEIQTAFGVDYTEWETLHEKKLVSPHNLSRQELERLSDIRIFDEALQLLPTPAASLSVPLALEEIQAHWTRLARHCFVNRYASQALFDAIEIIDAEKGTRRAWLRQHQQAEVAARGVTYLDIHQVERQYAAGWRQTVSIDEWLALRQENIVDEGHLTEHDVRRLVSVPFFKELYDLKFNQELKWQRIEQVRAAQQEREKRTRRLLLGVVAVVLTAAATAWFLIQRQAEQPRSQATEPTTGALPAPSNAQGNPVPSAPTNAVVARPPKSSEMNKEAKEVATQSLIDDTMWPKIQAAEERVKAVLSVASDGNLEETKSSEKQRADGLAYPVYMPTIAPDPAYAVELNRRAKAVFRKDLERAEELQWEAALNAPHLREIVGNLAYYQALRGKFESAQSLSLYALSLPDESAETGRSADWHILAVTKAKVDPSASFNAFLVALSISKNLDGFCKTLLAHGRDFGDDVKSVVTRVFDRLERVTNGDPLPQSCASPPAF